ncbi:MAG: hypothetical protein JWO59_1781 [Chloroflexi bacterium]|nr:hypothetical protein [Chloroflexota bacterium]
MQTEESNAQRVYVRHLPLGTYNMAPRTFSPYHSSTLFHPGPLKATW